MAAAWLLSTRHRVSVFEAAPRLGGHTNTVEVPSGTMTQPVDTGFIVYNEATYPNLTALFAHLEVATHATEMSFSVSLDNGRLEYAGKDLAGLFAQRRNLVSPRFLSMLWDLLRFYREAPGRLAALEGISLGAFLDRGGYGRAFRDDHLLPMAAAIWSAPSTTLLDFPAVSFVRFCETHGLLKIINRPVWRTVTGGSKSYVAPLTASYASRITLDRRIVDVRRDGESVWLRDNRGEMSRFDHVVIATHADQALRMLETPTPRERMLLGAFRYRKNRAVLHRDQRLMPRRENVWASWNYLGQTGGDGGLCVTYWMNRLQRIQGAGTCFLTLNPRVGPAGLLHEEVYWHPIFDLDALAAQKSLWTLQGQGNVWFCGAHFGAGFHEDGLQSGLAVAEALGGLRRPWTVADESGRIFLGATPEYSPPGAIPA